MDHSFWAPALVGSLRSVSFADVLDMAVVAVFIYSLLLWFEWTKAAFVARGILILGALYVVARQMGMVLTTWIFHGFFAVFVVALVVIFQEEIRRFFERLAVWSWREPQFHLRTEEVEILLHCLSHYARERVGALIVLRGRDPLERHLEGGVELDGKMSTALLQSIFDVHSEGHDGAVVLEGDRVGRFGVHLPLSKNLERLVSLGTRHAAALGISEVSDALCLVVSEQRGTISVAQNGMLQRIDELHELESLLTAFLKRGQNRPVRSRWADLFLKNKAEKLLAGGVSLLLWLVLVEGFKPDTRTLSVPVQVQNVSDGLRVRAVSPRRVSLVLSGLKRDLDLLNTSQVKVALSAEGRGPGLDRILISEDNVRIPENMRFLSADPPSVEVEVSRVPSDSSSVPTLRRSATGSVPSQSPSPIVPSTQDRL